MALIDKLDDADAHFILMLQLHPTQIVSLLNVLHKIRAADVLSSLEHAYISNVHKCFILYFRFLLGAFSNKLLFKAVAGCKCTKLSLQFTEVCEWWILY